MVKLKQLKHRNIKNVHNYPNERTIYCKEPICKKQFSSHNEWLVTQTLKKRLESYPPINNKMNLLLAIVKLTLQCDEDNLTSYPQNDLQKSHFISKPPKLEILTSVNPKVTQKSKKCTSQKPFQIISLTKSLIKVMPQKSLLPI